MAQSAKPTDHGVSIGQVFLGKYRVDAILGAGGMGVVAECTHLALDEKVAIKMLRSDVVRDPDAEERFMREAQAASKLKSEYVARVFDVGRFQNGVPYMVMEFLQGLDLDRLIQERGHLEIPWTVELVLQTAEALAEAHSIGIVHRDVKPSNLFVTWRPDGTSLVKVLDFGISKSSVGTDMQLTQTQSVLGTPSYMSPEQMRSARNVDARTDIWSLGTVLYEVLEGRRPFEADSFSEMCVKVAIDAPTPMLRTPPAMEQVVMRCLEKTPELRYASMADLGRDLVPFANDPHQASALVERMQRMLRRSQADWDVKSSPTHTTQPTPLPGVVARGLTPPPGTLPSYNADGSAPFVRPSMTFAITPRRRSRAPLVVALLAIVGGVAAGLIYTASMPPNEPARAVAPEPPKPPDPPAAALHVVEPVVVPPVVAPTPPDPKPPDPASAKGAENVAADHPAEIEMPVTTKLRVPAVPKPRPNPPVGKVKKPEVVKEQVKEPPPPPQPKPKCADPFDSRSGSATPNCTK